MVVCQGIRAQLLPHHLRCYRIAFDSGEHWILTSSQLEAIGLTHSFNYPRIVQCRNCIIIIAHAE